MTDYNKDVIAWATEQVALLRAGKFSDLDIEHIADEIESVGRTEIRVCETHVAELLAHLLTWQYLRPERTARLQERIAALRSRVKRDLQRTPSLSASLVDAEWWTIPWQDAILASIADAAARRYGLPQICPWAAPHQIPKTCPWTTDQVLDATFFPD